MELDVRERPWNLITHLNLLFFFSFTVTLLSPGQRQAIIWANGGILLIRT